MAHFSPALSLALLISSAASVVIPEPGGNGGIIVAVTPTACSLQTNPTNSPAWNIPTYCNCGAAGAYPAITPTATPAGIQPTAIPRNQSAPAGNQFCEYLETEIPSVTPITPTPFSCNLESAATGFTVPNSWCGCTAGTSTSTYSTKFRAPFATGTAVPPACNFMQDELPAGTIAPTAAHCVVASATPGGTFYDALAWCACGDDAPHPLIPATSAACAYTTVPASTITPSPIASTSCRLSSVALSFASYCECDGAGTTARYAPATTAGESCVFDTVPSATATFPSLVGLGAGSPVCLNPGGCYACDYDGLTIVSLGYRFGGGAPSYLLYKTCPDGFKCAQKPGSLMNTPPDCVALFPSPS